MHLIQSYNLDFSIRKLTKRVKQAEFFNEKNCSSGKYQVIWVCSSIPASFITIVQSLTNHYVCWGTECDMELHVSKIEYSSLDDNVHFYFLRMLNMQDDCAVRCHVGNFEPLMTFGSVFVS